jgi:hypothetical protein
MIIHSIQIKTGFVMSAVNPVVTKSRSHHPELDPQKPYHVTKETSLVGAELGNAVDFKLIRK